jgi:GNAT superfamily N-acetyltransferase
MTPPPAAGRPFEAEAYVLDGCRLAAFAADDGRIAAIAGLVAAGEPWRRLGLGAADIAAYLQRPDPGLRRFRILDRQGDAGLLCLRFPWLIGAYIELVAVAPGRRGGGIGAGLVAWMAAQLRPSPDIVHGRNLWATVSAFNDAGRRFYAGQGFDEVAPLADLVRWGETEILLRKRLG